MKVGDLVRRTHQYKGSSPSGAIGIILVIDKDMVKVSSHGWWSKHATEVISEYKIRNR